jgi:hypothetical protein
MQSSSTQQALLARIERHSHAILALMFALFVATLFVGLTAKLNGWAQGYDQIDYQQSIWNTTQGRFLEISHYRHTDHLWGMDFIPAILLIVPFYALFPSPLTLNFFQAFCMGLGAIPTYAIARDRFGSHSIGLAFAALFLLYPSTWFATMSAPWQPRMLAVPLLLGAFFFLQRGLLQGKKGKNGTARSYGWYLACCCAALLTRTDTSLCVLALGLLAALWRMPLRWVLPPMLIAMAWFSLSTNVIVPNFYRDDYVPKEIRGGPDACTDYSTNWPGKSPQLAYYCHLGGSSGEIIVTILTQPLKVAQIVLTREKLTYLLLMLLPLLLLPLLAPDAALPALPILAMNVLSNRPFQYTVREQYQTLVIPGLIIATIIGAWRLWQWYQRNRTHLPQQAPALLLGLLLFAGLAANIAYRNPVVTTLRYRETPERLTAMRELAALVPADAPLAVSSFLAPNMMPRREIFYFPNSPSFPPIERAEYVFIDLRAAALENELGQNALAVVRDSDNWRVLAAREDLILYQRVNP